MEYTKNISLNLIPDGNIPVVRIKQGDASTRYIHATMTWGDDPAPIGSELTVLFRMEKPDGTCVLADSEHVDQELHRYLVVINNDGTVTVELTSQTSTYPGLSLCDLCLLSGQKVLSTASFVIAVEKIPDVSTSAVSSDDFRTLVNALADVGQTSPVYLSSMSDVNMSDLLDGEVLVYDASTLNWVNQDPDVLGYTKESDVRSIVTGYGYQTSSQVNTLIANYINSLNANETEY